jgi:hypothetical protein
MTVLRLLGTQGTLASASNVGFAKLVRVLNNHSAVQLITQKSAATEVLANVTLGIGEVAYIQKAPTDTLTGAATSLAVSVGFAN